MKVFGVVYLIQNLVNGKKYIGQTIKTVKERFNEHSWENTVISKAIRKHGKENFRYGVIKSCASKEEMDYWEKFFIAALKTKSPNGYNLTDGGEGIIGLKHTQETLAKMSAAHKGKTPSQEHRVNLGLARRGESPYKKLIIEIDAHYFSYSSLAKLLGIQSVSDKMHGKVRFTDEDIAKLVEIFGKPAEYLMTRTDGLSATTSKAEGFAKISALKRGHSPYKNLLNEIVERQLTYRGLSKLTGICKSALPLKMSGKVKFTADEIAKLVEIFDKPAEYLMARDDGLPTTVSKLYRTPYKNLLFEIEHSKFNHTSLANLLGFTKQTFSRKIRGQQNFTARDKAKLAEIFDKPIEYLMFKEEFSC